MAGHVHQQRAIRLLVDLLEGDVEFELDPLGHRDLEQPVADLLVIAAQDHVGAVDQRHMRTKLVEDAGKFIGDIARPCDHHALGEGIEMEHFIRGDAMLGPRKMGRSEEHTSELQSLMRSSYAVLCLKKKQIKPTTKSKRHTNRKHIYLQKPH